MGVRYAAESTDAGATTRTEARPIGGGAEPDVEEPKHRTDGYYLEPSKRDA